MALSTPLLDEEKKSGVVFSCGTYHYGRLILFALVLLEVLPWVRIWWTHTPMSPMQRQYFHHILPVWLVREFFIWSVTGVFIMQRFPHTIQVHADGSLVLVRRFNAISFPHMESAQHNPKCCWMGQFRRAKTDYATCIKTRVIVKLATGTKVIVTPDDAAGFLAAVEQVSTLTTTTSSSEDSSLPV